MTIDVQLTKNDHGRHAYVAQLTDVEVRLALSFPNSVSPAASRQSRGVARVALDKMEKFRDVYHFVAMSDEHGI